MDNVAQNNIPPKADGHPHALSLKELLALELPAAKWAVDGLIESGAITMLSALWGQRKSWLCLHAAICVAGGLPVFGVFTTEKQGVLVINEEDTVRQIQERMNILAPPSDDLPIFFLVGQGFRLTDAGVAWLVAEAESKAVGVVIFDSLRSIHGMDENDSATMQAVMDKLKCLTREGLTVLFSHHNRKPAAGQRSGDHNGEETRGSGAINAAVHGHLSLESVKGEDGGEYVIVRQCKSKSAERVASFKVKVEKLPDGHLSFVHAGEHKSENAATKTAEGVMTALRASGRWMNVKELERVGFAKERAIRTALGELKRSGRVAVTTRGETEGLPGAGAANEEFFIAVGGESDPFLPL